MTHSDQAGPTPVTMIGLGLMGRALAAAFLADGHPTTVWNRSAGKADELVAGGAALAASARDAVTAGPLVIICLTDYRAVRELLEPLADELAGRVLINLTSGTSQEARDLAAWAADRDVTYLDGVILAVPQAIGTADAVLLYSGPPAAFEAHESTLRSLAAATTYLGADHGLSPLYDMAVLTVMWNVLNGFLHGAALLTAAQVEAATFAPFANQLIATMAGWITAYGDQIDAGRYPADDSTIDTHRAAMDHLIHEGAALGVNVELSELIKKLADRAVASGRGGDSYAAMIEQFRAPAPPAR